MRLLIQRGKRLPWTASQQPDFVVCPEEWTNIIAGKKSILDQQFEQLLGRSMYQNMKKRERRIAANQVSLNPGS